MRILVTGGNGFLGVNLAALLSTSHSVLLASRNNKRNLLAQVATGCRAIPTDITNIESLRECILHARPHVIIHAAATKFVDLSELYPSETIEVNVLGSLNVARVARELGVSAVIGISTDKAAPPCVNTYALSKAMMERLFVASDELGSTRFFCLRYGNVAWSTGSVLPVWRSMIRKDNIISTCGSNMFRYMLRAADAIAYIEESLRHIDLLGGKIVALDMKSIQISDLLRNVQALTGCQVQYLPPRQGERFTEYMVGETELEFTARAQLGQFSCYMIDFANRIQDPHIRLTKSVSAETSPKLSDDEITSIVGDFWNGND